MAVEFITDTYRNGEVELIEIVLDRLVNFGFRLDTLAAARFIYRGLYVGRGEESHLHTCAECKTFRYVKIEGDGYVDITGLNLQVFDFCGQAISSQF